MQRNPNHILRIPSFSEVPSFALHYNRGRYYNYIFETWTNLW
jgi:hypothetical protein